MYNYDEVDPVLAHTVKEFIASDSGTDSIHYYNFSFLFFEDFYYHDIDCIYFSYHS